MNKSSDRINRKLDTSYYIETYGCTANKVDTEIMTGILNNKGYVKADLGDADYIIVNTCGVKSVTEEKILYRLKQLSKLNKKLIIAGCLPKINLRRIKKAIPNYAAIFGPESIDRVADILIKVRSDSNLIFKSKKRLIKPKLPCSRLDKVIGRIQISTGCLSSCSYCCTKFARGKLFSYPMGEVVNRVKSFVRSGCKEIRLTSQDTAVYGLDNNNTLPTLLRNVLKVRGKFRVRVGMMNPTFAKRIIDDLIDSYSNKKIYKFIHLPVQSGSNEILKLMKRGYVVEEFLEIVKRYKRKYPNATLWTDVITGFPGETPEQFQDTADLINRVKPDVVNISKFYPRPKTKAAKMKRIPTEIVKKRSKKMTELCRKISYEINQKWLDKEVEVLIVEKGAKGGVVGRTNTYKPVVLPKGKEDLIGKFLRVKIKKAKTNYLIGDTNGC